MIISSEIQTLESMKYSVHPMRKFVFSKNIKTVAAITRLVDNDFD